MRDRTNAKVARFKDYSSAKYFDYILLGIVALLIFFGLVMLYSSSAYSASIKQGDPAYYLKRQALFVIAGGFFAMIITFIPYRLFKNFANLIYGAVFLVNVAVIFIGHSGNGSTRWISVGGFTLQPSEFMKTALIIMLAAFISTHTKYFCDRNFNIACLGITIFSVAPVISSNLSTAVIIAGIGFIMTFIASRRKKQLVAVAIVGIAGVAVATVSRGYRADRIIYWFHPERATTGKGFQILQGLYAIGSGSFFGKGLGASDTKQYLPESQNDMIFSVIVEELGAFGAVCLILMYIILLYRLYVVAVSAKDMFGSFLVIGVFSHLALQMILNMLVVTNLLPNTGVTLPFISYGGSSIVCTLCEIGLALSVSRQIPLENLSLEKEA